MKSNYSRFWQLALAVLAVLNFSACKDEDEAQETAWMASLQSIVYRPATSDGRILIEEGEPFSLTYQVTPAELAAVIASQTAGTALSLVPRLPAVQILTTTEVTATADGRLTITAVPSSTEPGRSYLFSLAVTDGQTFYLADPVELYRAGLPVVVPSVALSSESVSQILAE